MYERYKLAVMERSRRSKLEQFYSRYRGGAVLDVGVSGRDWSSMENFFLKSFTGNDRDYTALGIEELSELAARYPGRTFVQYPGGRFPFRNGEFEWVYANAVIEHVGTRREQVAFLDEMLRVARNVFFTTPNRWFPVESHTNVIFLHFWPYMFYRWCARRGLYWNPNTLNLLGQADLQQILANSRAADVEIMRNTVAGMTMTFSIFCMANA